MDMMRQMLDFAGAILFAVVIPVITPILLLVYLFLGALVAVEYIKKVNVSKFIPSFRFKIPALPFLLKRYLLLQKG